MLELINTFLATFGINTLYSADFNVIIELIKDDRKVDAVKHLRDFTKVTEYRRLVKPKTYNTFANWLQDTDHMAYFDTRKLGLKEAKDIVWFLADNMEACKR